jgi:predicted MFS family arabinose efflux permease
MIKRWGERRLLAVAFGLAGLLLLAVTAASTSFVVVLAAIFVLGFQQATVPVAAMALVGSAATRGARQAGFGLLFAASEVGVAFALAISQAGRDLLDHGSVVYLLFGTLYVLGSLAAWRLRFTARE